MVLQQMGGQGLNLFLYVRALCTGLARCFCSVVPDFYQHFLYKTNFLARLIHMLILLYKMSGYTSRIPNKILVRFPLPPFKAFYCNMAVLIHYRRGTQLLQNWRVDYTTWKSSNIYYLAPHKKSLLAPDLEYESNLSLHKPPSDMCSLLLARTNVSSLLTRKKHGTFLREKTVQEGGSWSGGVSHDT